MRRNFCVKYPEPTYNPCTFGTQEVIPLITKMPPQRSLVSVLPRVICLTLCLHLFQVLADALRVNQSIQALALYDNPIGDEGVKAWWPPRGEFGGPSRALNSNGSYSCKWFHNL